MEYTLDGLNRLTQAEEGSWSGSAITSLTRDQTWTLPHEDNWDLATLDKNGDGDSTDYDDGEYTDNRNHDIVNQFIEQDRKNDPAETLDDFDLTYDGNGQLDNDGQSYKYEYDPLGRLRKIKKRTDSSLVAEFWYNGLNHRVIVHEDTDADGDVDGSDTKLHLAYDQRWRVRGVFEDSDTAPTEEFLYHAAGLDGRGSSSYIDNVILRDRDTTGNGALDERVYYCHNWRNDVVALISDTGSMVESVRYTAYGIPYGVPMGDTNGTGAVNVDDTINILNWWGASDKPMGDTNLDGTIDGTDRANVASQYGSSGGWGVLSDSANDNRKGYAGYEFDNGPAPNSPSTMSATESSTPTSDGG